MIFIDANLFIAYDNINDVQHNRAVELFHQIERDVFSEAFTSDYVFNEVIGITFRKKGHERAIILGKHILNSMLILNIDDHLLKEGWNFFSTTSLNLNLVDCTNVILTKFVRSNKIATFDKEFTKVQNLQVFS